MLGHTSVTTIVPVIDMDRAREFYTNRLGLLPRGMNPDGKFIYAAGGEAFIALIQKASGTKADHTALSFEVQNIDTTIQELTARGVIFTDYDLPGLKTVNHVCVLGAEKAAWFHDPEGNILCIHEVIA